MTDEDPQAQIDEAKQSYDEEIGELEDDADEMEDRLTEHESEGEDVEVPEPDQGDEPEK